MTDPRLKNDQPGIITSGDPSRKPEGEAKTPQTEPMEGIDSPDMVQAFKDLNTLHPDYSNPGREAALRIFMWCRRADAILKARSAPEPSSAKGPASPRGEASEPSSYSERPNTCPQGHSTCWPNNCPICEAIRRGWREP